MLSTPYKKSSPIPQIGVFTKICVASFECSKYVVTMIFIFLLWVQSLSYVGLMRLRVLISLFLTKIGSSICTKISSSSLAISWSNF